MWFYLFTFVLGIVIFIVVRNYLSGDTSKKPDDSTKQKPKSPIATPPVIRVPGKEEPITTPKVTPKPAPITEPVAIPPPVEVVKKVVVEEEPKPKGAEEGQAKEGGEQKHEGDKAAPHLIHEEGSGGLKTAKGHRSTLKNLTAELQKKRRTGHPATQPQAGDEEDKGDQKPVLTTAVSETSVLRDLPPHLQPKKSAGSVVVPKWLQEDGEKKKSPLKKARSEGNDLRAVGAGFEAKRRMVEMLQLGQKPAPALVVAEENVGVEERMLKDSQVEAEMAEIEAAKLEEEIRRLEEEIEADEEDGEDGPEDDGDGGEAEDGEDEEAEGGAAETPQITVTN